MKKIWPWLLLLLLLIIFCVWSKKDNIQLNSTNKIHSVTTPQITLDSHPIEFVLAQKTKGNTLNGRFTNIQQQNLLSHTCNAASSPLKIENTSTNETLTGQEVIELTNKILPHFLAHYSEGSIRYHDQVLKINGLVDSYQAQRKMQQLLNTSTLASQDNSHVLVTKPIEFSITKDINKMHFKGIFNNKAQMSKIHARLPRYVSTSFTQEPHRVDNGIIAITETILPNFTKRYSHGKIVYKDAVLTVSGMVETDEDLNYMKQLLSAKKTPIVNQTTLDLKAVEKRKEEAKLAQLALEKKAQEEAQKRAALNQAAALAKQKAEEEAKRQEAENQKAEALRLEKAKLAAQTKQAAKEKIIHLLQIENIEFETAKGTLTKKGKETVDKLALILKQYPNIKAEIAGHTDSDGSADFNQKLSQSRVETVKGRLIARGVNAGR
ncbi:MAG TPA: hypothetical protein ENK68_01400, partial [Epsilonproteobacteria bacterium]|nr:hypothetical protein [Campylobacterota bacterium]